MCFQQYFFSFNFLLMEILRNFKSQENSVLNAHEPMTHLTIHIILEPVQLHGSHEGGGSWGLELGPVQTEMCPTCKRYLTVFLGILLSLLVLLREFFLTLISKQTFPQLCSL